MKKITLTGSTSLLPNNLISFSSGSDEVPVVCGKDSVAVGKNCNNKEKIKFVFQDNQPICVLKLTK